MPLQFETVAVPVSSGVNLTTPARLLSPASLLEATNSRFPRGAGATKRRGHTASLVRGMADTPPEYVVNPLTPPTPPGLFSTSLGRALVGTGSAPSSLPNAPVVVGSVSLDTVTNGDLPLTWPAHQAGDIGLIIAGAQGGSTLAEGLVTLAVPAGFDLLGESDMPVSPSIPWARTRVFWCRATSSSMANPTIHVDTKTAKVSFVLVRGCVADGAPFQAVVASGKQGVDATVLGGTTTTDQALVFAVDTGNPGEALPHVWSNSNLTGVTSRLFTDGAASGTLCFGYGTGVKRLAGPIGTTVGAQANVRYHAMLSFAMVPEPAARPQVTDWLWGWGLLAGDDEANLTDYQVSALPSAGVLFGAANRDNEAVMWDGFRLYSRAPSQTGRLPTFNAAMPMLRSQAVAKTNHVQSYPDIADTGRIKVTAWLAPGASNNDVYYTVQDSHTLAVLNPTTGLGLSDVKLFKVINVGDWVHILVTHSEGLLHRFSIHHNSVDEATKVSLGSCPIYFDAWKVNENSFVAVRNITNDTGDADPFRVAWYYANGAPNFFSHVTSTPLPDATAAKTGPVAIAAHPRGGFGLVWRYSSGGSNHFVAGKAFNADGSGLGPQFNLQAVAPGDYTKPVAIAPTFVGTVYHAYYDYAAGGLQVSKFSNLTSTNTTRPHLNLASAAFRCGNRTFVWAGRSSRFQSQFFLLDEGLLPVGRTELITANVYTGGLRPLPTVNWHIDGQVGLGEAEQAYNPTVFHGAFSYRARVISEPPAGANNAPPQYADPSIKHYVLDMLPPLRSAQAGRSTYFPGAQLWAYDGNELTESGFHVAPEPDDIALSAAGSGGGLSAGEYRYRVDLCYRNAYNEEIRSISFYTDPVTPTAGQKVTLTINTCLTRRENAYFLIYRNEAIGSQWYLVNSRDPASAQFLRNDLTASAVTFLDDGLDTPTDAELVSREPHPGNGGFGYLVPFSAPAAEIIAAGHDRLWLAGGELSPGQVLPSRLFTPDEAPAWHLGLVVQVDRAVEPITAIGFAGESRAYFRKTQTYVHQGAGPDNNSQGGWESVRLAYSDVGAVGPEGLALVSAGLLFQSPAGIRMFQPGGGIQNVGAPVDLVAKSMRLAAALVVGEDQEVRFYALTGPTLVFNYQYGIWSTWTVNAVGVTYNPDTKLAVVARPDGLLWEEADGVWTDNVRPYLHRVRFAWLHKGELMDFQRVRRIGALGECDASQPHSIHVDVYYDERDFAEEQFDWQYPDPNTQNTDTFGAGAFGDGVLGDTGED